MITVVVGHRGTGKTKFLERVKTYYGGLGQEIHAFDLDAAIIARTQKSIQDIFTASGETGFRDLENKIFKSIYSEAEALAGTVYIAVGAGFSGEIPLSAQVLWLRRPTDATGRIFIDRPRLEAELSPIEEYQSRFKLREDRFRQIYHRQLTVSEGFDEPNEFEPVVLGLKPFDLGAAITVLPQHLCHSLRLEDFIQNQLLLGVRYFELRDDLLSVEQIVKLAGELPREKVLISFRRRDTSPQLIEFSGAFDTDWALELGPSPFDHNKIISVHQRNDAESVDDVVARLKAVKAEHYKLAIAINDYIELWSGHRFFIQNTERHSFLPNSATGRWQWYRLAQNRKMKLNFVREGAEGSSLDQPTIFDFVRYPRSATHFAAVLGSPVGHSYTPAEQSAFFADLNMGVLAIEMAEIDCNSLSMSVLERMGLRAAAVTAPLKMLAARVCAYLDKTATELGAVNTMSLTSQGWAGTNTDVVGLAALLKNIDFTESMAVWGGGGTRLVLKFLLPEAQFFSARRAEQIWVDQYRERMRKKLGKNFNFDSVEFSPETVLWALGRSRMKTSHWPPAQWRPKYVVDLNYSEDSPGLEYAQKVGAIYISGRAFFRAQAAAQREYWSRELVVDIKSKSVAAKAVAGSTPAKSEREI